jgi:transposase
MRSPGPPEGGPGLRRRLEAVITTAAMNEAGKSAWCREHGVYPPTWTSGAQRHHGAGRPRGRPRQPAGHAADRKRIKELERDLLRKDRALAETAALLVLSKKVAAIFNKGEDE